MRVSVGSTPIPKLKREIGVPGRPWDNPNRRGEDDFFVKGLSPPRLVKTFRCVAMNQPCHEKVGTVSLQIIARKINANRILNFAKAKKNEQDVGDKY